MVKDAGADVPAECLCFNQIPISALFLVVSSYIEVGTTGYRARGACILARLLGRSRALMSLLQLGHLEDDLLWPS
jgi:hypothetical protein